jgi:cobalamin biosynthesis Mg chelatase CobN
MDVDPQALTDALREELGESLRTVAVGDVEARDYELTYIRDDVAALYDDEDVEAAFRAVAVERVGADIEDDLYEPLGRTESTIRTYENGINVLLWAADAGAVFVGLDDDPTRIPRVLSVGREFVTR